jgi:hypothetical protein
MEAQTSFSATNLGPTTTEAVAEAEATTQTTSTSEMTVPSQATLLTSDPATDPDTDATFLLLLLVSKTETTASNTHPSVPTSTVLVSTK